MKVSFYTLGCRVNQYETQMLKDRFRDAGFETVGEEEWADVYVINTCTVTNLADRKSRQYIRRMKRLNPAAFVCVTGCYAQVSAEEVAAVSGVDLVVGTSDKAAIPHMVVERIGSSTPKKDESSMQQRYDYAVNTDADGRADDFAGAEVCVRPHEPGEKYVETGTVTSMEGRTRAYIKVQEGCNRFCTYCEIPFARGDVRSRQPADILKEAVTLLSQGFKELVLTGINTALYGTEENFSPDFERLAEAMSGPESTHSKDENISRYKEFWKESCDESGRYSYGTGLPLILMMLEDIDADFRIRIGSLEPTVVDIKDVKRILGYSKLCHHLHLSIQSGSDNVLKAMNRHYDRKQYKEIAGELYKFDSHFGISTDIIGGFPTESEQDHRDSLKIIEEIPFCKVHAFDYSRRRGTKADAMKGHINPEIKKRRVRELIEQGDKTQKAFFRSSQGDSRTVLIEEYISEAGCYVGYTDNYIRTYIRADQKENNNLIGSFACVRLLKAYRDGMLAEII